MSAGLWVVQIFLALIFAGVGLLKLTQPYEQVKRKMAVVSDYSPRTIRLIGLMEIVGAAGVVLPAVMGRFAWLTPLAAIDLTIVMLVSIAAHLRRQEIPMAAGNAVLLVLAASVAYGRFVA